MTPARIAPRWALSFADLCLLLLGFFILLHAQRAEPERVAEGVRAAFNGTTPTLIRAQYRAAAIFLPGEAILRPAARRDLAKIGRDAARTGGAVRVESQGVDGGTRRFDSWELAAARAAAVARALREGGLPERRVTIAMPGGAVEDGGQRIGVTVGR
jgi:flagellar motor protein MotB